MNGRRRRPLYPLGVAALVALLGCSDDSENGNGDPCSGSEGLAEPTCQLLSPDKEPVTESGSADYSCLENVTPPMAPNKDLVVRGKTQQRLSNGDNEDKGEVTVEVWTDQTSLSDATRIAKTTSDAAGNYELVIPTSAWPGSSPGVRVAWRISAPDTVPTVEYDDPLPIEQAQPDSTDPTKLAIDGVDRITVTRSTLQTINGLLGTTNEYDKNMAIIMGAVRDCKRKEVQNASAGIVDSAGKPVSGPLLFYFRNNFPSPRTQQTFTSEDGLFAILNVPVGKSVEARVIGKLKGEDKLLSRILLPTASDTLVIADFDPLPEPLK